TGSTGSLRRSGFAEPGWLGICSRTGLERRVSGLFLGRRTRHNKRPSSGVEIAMADCRYCLRSRIDMVNAAEIRADLSRVIGSNAAHLLVDCRHLSSVDSTGIAVWLEQN